MAFRIAVIFSQLQKHTGNPPMLFLFCLKNRTKEELIAFYTFVLVM